MTDVRMNVNGRTYSGNVEDRLLLVHFLRDVAKLKGVHVGCDTGHCGACTILFNGKPIKSCQIFAVQANNAEIMTVEGLADEKEASIEQRAFMNNFAIQCGYCTPGMLIMTRYLIRKYPKLSRDEIRDYLHGNYCICTGYSQIVDAVEQAHREFWKSKEPTLPEAGK